MITVIDESKVPTFSEDSSPTFSEDKAVKDAEQLFDLINDNVPWRTYNELLAMMLLKNPETLNEVIRKDITGYQAKKLLHRLIDLLEIKKD